MKHLVCSNENCNTIQKTGKFCLDCGHPLNEVFTKDIQFKPIKTKRNSEALKRDVRNWLSRIGCAQTDIKMRRDGDTAEVEYVLDGNEYQFSSHLQANYTNNLAAVEQFLHARVLGIERGIETVEQAFKGYEALPDPNTHIRTLSDSELRQEIKLYHPDVGDGNLEKLTALRAEMERRRKSRS